MKSKNGNGRVVVKLQGTPNGFRIVGVDDENVKRLTKENARKAGTAIVKAVNELKENGEFDPGIYQGLLSTLKEANVIVWALPRHISRLSGVEIPAHPRGPTVNIAKYDE